MAGIQASGGALMDLDRLSQRIKSHEGYRTVPYRDSLGFWTVGWGHYIHDMDLDDFDNVGQVMEIVLDPEVHVAWFENDLAEALLAAEEFAGPAWDQLRESRKGVITEMAFQLGEPKLEKFVKFQAAVLNGDFETARVEMLDSRWARKHTPRRAHILADIFFQHSGVA